MIEALLLAVALKAVVACAEQGDDAVALGLEVDREEVAQPRHEEHDDEGEETITLFGRDGGIRRPLEALEYAIAYLTCVV